MYVGPKLLQLLLVLDAEVLLLVHNHEAEILEGHLLGEDGVSADHDLESAVGEALAGFRGILGRYQTRKGSHLHRPAGEPLGKGLVVLAGREAWSGRTIATCLPLMATTKAARRATSVLPKPTSPQIRTIHRLSTGKV